MQTGIVTLQIFRERYALLKSLFQRRFMMVEGKEKRSMIFKLMLTTEFKNKAEFLSSATTHILTGSGFFRISMGSPQKTLFISLSSR